VTETRIGRAREALEERRRRGDGLDRKAGDRAEQERLVEVLRRRTGAGQETDTRPRDAEARFEEGQVGRDARSVGSERARQVRQREAHLVGQPRDRRGQRLRERDRRRRIAHRRERGTKRDQTRGRLRRSAWAIAPDRLQQEESGVELGPRHGGSVVQR